MIRKLVLICREVMDRAGYAVQVLRRGLPCVRTRAENVTVQSLWFNRVGFVADHERTIVRDCVFTNCAGAGLRVDNALCTQASV